MSNIQFEIDNFLVEKIHNEPILTFKKNGCANELRLIFKNDEISIEINSQIIALNATRKLEFNAPHIEIHASEKLNLESDGHASLIVMKDNLCDVGGIYKTEAKIVKIRSRLGNLELKANDDLKLDGERVKLNCDV